MGQVLVVGAEVVGVGPGLDDVVVLQGFDGGFCPVVAAEDYVGVDPGDVLCLGRALDAEIEEIFLVPAAGFGAHPDVVGAIGLAAEGFFAIGAFDDGQLDAGIQHVARETQPVAVRCGPAEGVGARGEDVQAGNGSTSYFGTILRTVTVDGWVVIALLAVMAGVSWWVMVNKFVSLRAILQDNSKFVQAFQKLSRDPGALDRETGENGDETMKSDFERALSGAHDHYQSSPIYRVYHVGVQELKHRFGQTDTRTTQGKILTPQAIDAIRASLDAAQVRETSDSTTCWCC